MNKKAEISLMLEAVLGVVLALLIVLALFGGVSRIINIFSSTNEKTDSFDTFKTKLDILTDEKKLNSNLGLKYDEIVFGVSKSSNLEFPTNIIYKNPLTNKEISFSKIYSPEECNKLACICKCKLDQNSIKRTIESKEIKCQKETINCFNPVNIESIEGDFIVNYVKETNDIKFSNINNNFVILSNSLTSQLKNKEEQYTIGLNLEKYSKTLKINLIK